jgi:hypothetical protein
MRLRLDSRGGLGKNGAWRKKERPGEALGGSGGREGEVRLYIKGSGGTKEKKKRIKGQT